MHSNIQALLENESKIIKKNIDQFQVCAYKARRSMEWQTPTDGGYSSVGMSAGLWFLRPWVRAPLPTLSTRSSAG